MRWGKGDVSGVASQGRGSETHRIPTTPGSSPCLRSGKAEGYGRGAAGRQRSVEATLPAYDYLAECAASSSRPPGLFVSVTVYTAATRRGATPCGCSHCTGIPPRGSVRSSGGVEAQVQGCSVSRSVAISTRRSSTRATLATVANCCTVASWSARRTSVDRAPRASRIARRRFSRGTSRCST